MKLGLKKSTIKQINDIFEKFPEVQKVILYGSRAKGNFKSGSDIDLTLIGNNLSLSLKYKIENDIDDLLLPYIFDISIFDKISNNALIEHINRVGITFYKK